ncbi:deaminase [uncultured Agrococcus sp.]|uniref:nucleoside deaminase n=1 Tax=uncultured Agrococcus sp. TaxID=382258 RepID=UPI0025F375D9|nr:deaminase [uncultured Agrococcus sp.]
MNNIHQQPTGYGVELPKWFLDARDVLPQRLPDPEERIRTVNHLATRTVAEGAGGPFAALVIDRQDGDIIAAGVNLVLHSGLASSHAEMVALGIAQTRKRAWNLAAAGEGPLLVVNAQPCAMCLGAIIWSGIGALEFSVEGVEVERLTGFDEGPVPSNWREQLKARGIEVATGRLRDESLDVLRQFRDRVDDGSATLYNGG